MKKKVMNICMIEDNPFNVSDNNMPSEICIYRSIYGAKSLIERLTRRNMLVDSIYFKSLIPDLFHFFPCCLDSLQFFTSFRSRN